MRLNQLKTEESYELKSDEGGGEGHFINKTGEMDRTQIMKHLIEYSMHFSLFPKSSKRHQRVFSKKFERYNKYF